MTSSLRWLLLALTSLAMVSGLSLVAIPQASAAAPYTVPGNHTINGRQWRTWCENYSSTIQRCWTEIKSGSQWTHNNLTYLPSSRAAWGKNPLANTGRWTSGGMKWRTECDTATTGGNGCRSYTIVNGRERLNSIVMFGTGPRVDVKWRPGSSYTTAGVEAAALNCINDYRARSGLKRWTRNASMDKMARAWATTMKNDKRLYHSTSQWRGSRGWPYSGENVAYSYRWDNDMHKDGVALCQMWLDSPGHLANIRSTTMTTTGMGVAFGPNGIIWSSNVFDY